MPAGIVPSEIRFATSKLLGMGTRAQTLTVRGEGASTSLGVQRHFMFETRSSKLDASQVAKLPDVVAGVQRLRTSYAALEPSDLVPNGQVWPKAGESRVDLPAGIVILPKNGNARADAWNGAVISLAKLVRSHTDEIG